MTTIGGHQPKTFAIIDSFNKKNVDIDSDEKPDVSHGEIVEKMLLTEQPDAKIIRYDVSHDKVPGATNPDRVYDALTDVARRIDSGEKIDGVNYSASDDQKINIIGIWVKGRLTKNNIADKKEEIKNNFHKLPENKTVKALEKVASKGTPVYIPSGNKSSDNYNLLGVAKGVTQVGSTNDKGEKEKYSGNNSDVKTWAQGTYKVNFLKNDSGKITGYDYTGDGKMDLPAEESTTKGDIDKIRDFGKSIKGTSYASPRALGRDTAN